MEVAKAVTLRAPELKLAVNCQDPQIRTVIVDNITKLTRNSGCSLRMFGITSALTFNIHSLKADESSKRPSIL